LNVLITGVSFGLGKSLKNQYLNMGKNVYGLSRTEVTDCKHKIFDLSILSDDTYSKVLEDLLEGQKYFDLVISLGALHNLNISDLKKSIQEIERTGKKKYIMVESYRNNKELFNLQCWALTCESFFSKNEWEWIFKEFRYKGDHELIYFE